MSAEIRTGRDLGWLTEFADVTARNAGVLRCLGWIAKRTAGNDLGTVSNCLVNHFRGVAIPRPENGPH